LDSIDVVVMSSTLQAVSRATLDELVAIGANHLLLNPVCRYAETVAVLAAAVGLPKP